MPLGNMMANNKNNTDDNSRAAGEPSNLSRRNLLKQAGLVGAAAIGGGAAQSALAASAEPSRPAQIPIREAYETLTAAQSAALDAIVNRIIPSDENGPGASEARAVHYIDRALAGFRSDSKEDYVIGLLAIDEHAQKTKSKLFFELSTSEQDEILMAVESNQVTGFLGSSASFFSMVHNHTIEGTFSDPYYGGNRDFVGWDMLGYPGVRMGSSDTEVRQGKQLAPSHVSAYDMAFTKQRRNRASNGGQ
jgi:gluconate 2-dehydrogenase gamma chain